jgi:hypothetical protein
VASDVEKTFHQIEIEPTDASLSVVRWHFQGKS